jgi:hypothetical protein
MLVMMVLDIASLLPILLVCVQLKSRSSITNA